MIYFTKRILSTIYRSLKNTIIHNGIEHAGYMSFIMLFSIFPFFLFISAMSNWIGIADIKLEFINLIEKRLPTTSMIAITEQVDEIVKSPPQSILTIAIIGSIWTNSSFLESLRTILNRIYQVNSPPSYILRRVLNILYFIIITTTINVVMFIQIFLPAIINKLYSSEILELYLKNTWPTYTIFTLILSTNALLYYMIPNVKLKFTEILPGALLCTIMWYCGGYLLSKYIRDYHQINFVYGSLGSVMITLLFFYMVNIIFIFCAEFNYIIFYKK